MGAEEKCIAEDVQGLDALPDAAVVMSAPWGFEAERRPFEKMQGSWYAPGVEEEIPSNEIALPAQILYVPKD